MLYRKFILLLVGLAWLISFDLFSQSTVDEYVLSYTISAGKSTSGIFTVDTEGNVYECDNESLRINTYSPQGIPSGFFSINQPFTQLEYDEFSETIYGYNFPNIVAYNKQGQLLNEVQVPTNLDGSFKQSIFKVGSSGTLYFSITGYEVRGKIIVLDDQLTYARTIDFQPANLPLYEGVKSFLVDEQHQRFFIKEAGYKSRAFRAFDLDGNFLFNVAIDKPGEDYLGFDIYDLDEDGNLYKYIHSSLFSDLRKCNAQGSDCQEYRGLLQDAPSTLFDCHLNSMRIINNGQQVYTSETHNSDSVFIKIFLLDSKIKQEVPDFSKDFRYNETYDLPVLTQQGLPITWWSSTNYFEVEENRVEVKAAGGPTSLIAFNEGNESKASMAEEYVVTIEKGEQEITFNSIGPKNRNADAFAVSAYNNRGLPIYYSSSNPLVATFQESNIVTITGVGSTKLTAFSPGDENLNEAKVTQELSVLDLTSILSLRILRMEKCKLFQTMTYQRIM